MTFGSIARCLSRYRPQHKSLSVVNESGGNPQGRLSALHEYPGKPHARQRSLIACSGVLRPRLTNDSQITVTLGAGAVGVLGHSVALAMRSEMPLNAGLQRRSRCADGTCTFSPITIRGLRSPGAIPPEAPSLRLRNRGGRGCSVPPVLGRSSST